MCYDQLITCESSERNGAAGQEKIKTGFCVQAEDVR
jgi:hypothetical protein